MFQEHWAAPWNMVHSDYKLAAVFFVLHIRPASSSWWITKHVPRISPGALVAVTDRTVVMPAKTKYLSTKST
uniref:Uncharacterized protein n=1 Tax=Physcomitrium patens TaxID=3218 RepID=A0A2K1JUC9_PHYPA|nr:hypothetical protein PHYPA_014903 [Physcomitrium patens]